jgi:AraC family transcriptional regulator, activator of mtrCDE
MLEAQIFSELVPFLRVRPELQQICRFGAQWASDHGPEVGGWAPFHIVTCGECLLDLGDRTTVELKAGDAAVLPHGGPHTVRALPNAIGPTTAPCMHRRLHDELVVKSNVEGEPDTKLICGRLRFEHAHDNMVLVALPPIVVLHGSASPDAARLQRIVETIQAEHDDDRLGAVAVAGSLATTLMMLVLRSHFESAGANHGIFALLGRRQTARALEAMLTELSRDWTLDELAERANTSRATLVRHFQNAVKMAPLAFLSELRFTFARRRLLAETMPLNMIAENAGYQSEAAFSRAYHRRFGVSPGADRKANIRLNEAQRDRSVS